MKWNTIIQQGDCFEHWHQVTCRSYSRTAYVGRPSADFNAKVSTCEFGALTLNNLCSATNASHPIRVVRNPEDIRKDPRDDFFLWFALDGSTTFTQNTCTVAMRPGDLVLHDQSRPFTLEFGNWSHAATVAIPRALLTARLAAPDKLVARRISRDTTLGALANAVFWELLQLRAPLAPDMARRLCGTMLDVWATTLENELVGNAGEIPKQRNRLAEVKQYMLANLGDADLGVEAIAHARNMAPRTLFRLFAAEGVTPIQWLWRQRLAACYTALAEKRVRHVKSAALEFGFADLSHFSRAFRAEFKCSPKEVLKGMRQQVQ